MMSVKMAFGIRAGYMKRTSFKWPKTLLWRRNVDNLYVWLIFIVLWHADTVIYQSHVTPKLLQPFCAHIFYNNMAKKNI